MSNTTICVFREREGVRERGIEREREREGGQAGGVKRERDGRETMGLAKTEARKPASLSRAL